MKCLIRKPKFQNRVNNMTRLFDKFIKKYKINLNDVAVKQNSTCTYILNHVMYIKNYMLNCLHIGQQDSNISNSGA